MNRNITQTIKYIGVDDKTIDLFESQYVVPNGVSYNSYLVEDEKIVVFDTVDRRGTDAWKQNLKEALKGKNVDLLIVSHLEPDHSANIESLATEFEDMKIVLTKKAAEMLPQFVEKDLSNRLIIVNDGDEISTGIHKFKFYAAPMVHWPEVMVTYDETDKVLFSADGFGKFGTLDTNEEWLNEARRYYANIVGKYGTQVQMLLKKMANIEIKIICPLHGPILNENIKYYLEKYNTWSSYEKEEKGILIAYTSIHGNTRNFINELYTKIKEKYSYDVVVIDLAREDITDAVANAFKYDAMIIATQTYDAGVFPAAENFVRRLKHKNYQKRKIAIIENGSWAPMAAKQIKEIFETMKDIEIIEPVITLKTKANQESKNLFKILIENITK